MRRGNEMRCSAHGWGHARDTVAAAGRQAGRRAGALLACCLMASIWTGLATMLRRAASSCDRDMAEQSERMGGRGCLGRLFQKVP